MGSRMLHRPAMRKEPLPRWSYLATELLLELLTLANGQPPPLPEPAGGTLRLPRSGQASQALAGN